MLTFLLDKNADSGNVIMKVAVRRNVWIIRNSESVKPVLVWFHYMYEINMRQKIYYYYYYCYL
jgi:hypothetical protein